METPATTGSGDAEIEVRDRTVATVDGHRLAATSYESSADSEGSIVINSALAIPRRFYRHVATWFARRRFDVLTFDYRGIGDSPPADVAASDASLTDWGERDIPACISWVHREFSNSKLFVFGHSLGGQVMGLVGDRVSLDGLVTFSAQSGYWRLQHPEWRWKTVVAMGFLFPVVTRAVGYLPWSLLFGGEDIPGPAALQWARWCMSPDYLFGDPSVEGLEHFHEFSAPVLAYSFEDDRWGAREAVDWMMDRFCNAPVERLHIAPGDVGVDRLGHFGVFRPGVEPLWRDLRDRLVEGSPSSRRCTTDWG